MKLVLTVTKLDLSLPKGKIKGLTHPYKISLQVHDSTCGKRIVRVHWEKRHEEDLLEVEDIGHAQGSQAGAQRN